MTERASAKVPAVAFFTMVKQVVREEKTFYVCEECGLAFMDKTIAKRCEQYYHKHKSCNLELIKFAVKLS